MAAEFQYLHFHYAK